MPAHVHSSLVSEIECCMASGFLGRMKSHDFICGGNIHGAKKDAGERCLLRKRQGFDNHKTSLTGDARVGLNHGVGVGLKSPKLFIIEIFHSS